MSDGKMELRRALQHEIRAISDENRADLAATVDMLKAKRVRKFEGLGFAIEFDDSAFLVEGTPAAASKAETHNPFFPKSEEP